MHDVHEDIKIERKMQITDICNINYLLFGIHWPPGTPLDSSSFLHETSLSIWPTTILSLVVVFTTISALIWLTDNRSTVFVSFNQCSLCSYELPLFKSWVSAACVPSCPLDGEEVQNWMSVAGDSVPYSSPPLSVHGHVSGQCPPIPATSLVYMGLQF